MTDQKGKAKSFKITPEDKATLEQYALLYSISEGQIIHAALKAFFESKGLVWSGISDKPGRKKKSRKRKPSQPPKD